MRTTLSIIHHQGIDWLRELEFYIDELGILGERLENAMSSTNGDIETMRQEKHFQNKFVSLRTQADVLTQEIIAREKKIDRTTEQMPDRVDEVIRLVDDRLFDRMALLAKGVAAARYDFNKFLSKTM
jgi:hypothetical protein